MTPQTNHYASRYGPVLKPERHSQFDTQAASRFEYDIPVNPPNLQSKDGLGSSQTEAAP